MHILPQTFLFLLIESMLNNSFNKIQLKWINLVIIFLLSFLMNKNIAFSSLILRRSKLLRVTKILFNYLEYKWLRYTKDVNSQNYISNKKKLKKTFIKFPLLSL